MSHKIEYEQYHSFGSYVDHNQEKATCSNEMNIFEQELNEKSSKQLNLDSADQREKTHSLLSRVYSTKKYAKWFDINETKTISKTSGSYTIYKIIYRFVSSDLNENIRELIVWKRFNEFKKLHAFLFDYHQKLNRPKVTCVEDTDFPVPIKTAYFGRFNEGTINERKEYILNVLRFCSTQMHLYAHEKFIEFFTDGVIAEVNMVDESSNVLIPTKIKDSVNDSIKEFADLKISSELLAPSQEILPKIDENEIDTRNISEIKTEENRNELLKSLDYEIIESIEDDEVNAKYSDDIKLIELNVSFDLPDDAIGSSENLNDFNSDMQLVIVNNLTNTLSKLNDFKKLYNNSSISSFEDDKKRINILNFKMNLLNKIVKNILDLTTSKIDILQKRPSITPTIKFYKLLLSRLADLVVIAKNYNDSYSRIMMMTSLRKMSNEIFRFIETKININFDFAKIDFNYLFRESPRNSSDPNVILSMSYLSRNLSLTESRCSNMNTLGDFNKNFKIKGLINKNLLLINSTQSVKSEFVIKIVKKSIGNYNNDEIQLNQNSRQKKDSYVIPANTVFKFLTKLFNFYENENSIYLLLQKNENFKPLYDLYHFEDNRNVFAYDEESRSTALLNTKLYLAQLLSAIESLHTIGIFCADLKPKNILVDVIKLHRIRLTYFFTSSCIDTEICKEAVDGCYVAPEISDPVMQHSDIFEACDIWSFGVITYELSELKKFSKIFSYENEDSKIYLNMTDQQAENFISNVVQMEASKRLSISEIKSHKFFNNIEWSEL